MNKRIPVKTTLDTLSVALISGGLTMVTTSDNNVRMVFGCAVIILGILTYITRHTWNSKEWEKENVSKGN